MTTIFTISLRQTAQKLLNTRSLDHDRKLNLIRPLRPYAGRYGWIKTAIETVLKDTKASAEALIFLADRLDGRAPTARMAPRRGKTARKAPGADAARLARREARAAACRAQKGINPPAPKHGPGKKKAKKG